MMKEGSWIVIYGINLGALDHASRQDYHIHPINDCYVCVYNMCTHVVLHLYIAEHVR